MSDHLGSGLAFPLQVDQRGGVALASGTTDVEQALRIILMTAPGERPMRPEFGCAAHDHVYDVMDVAALGQIESAVRVAIERWEPRVEVVGVDFDTENKPEPGGESVPPLQREGKLKVSITYSVRDVPGVRNLVHPFYIIGDEPPDEDVEVLDGVVVEP